MSTHYDPENEVPYFLVLGGASVLVAAIMVALNPWIKKKMAGVR